MSSSSVKLDVEIQKKVETKNPERQKLKSTTFEEIKPIDDDEDVFAEGDEGTVFHNVHSDGPLSQKQIEELAKTPFWRGVRTAVLVSFWLVWLAMLSLTIYFIVHARDSGDPTDSNSGLGKVGIFETKDDGKSITIEDPHREDSGIFYGIDADHPVSIYKNFENLTNSSENFSIDELQAGKRQTDKYSIDKMILTKANLSQVQTDLALSFMGRKFFDYKRHEKPANLKSFCSDETIIKKFNSGAEAGLAIHYNSFHNDDDLKLLRLTQSILIYDFTILAGSTRYSKEKYYYDSPNDFLSKNNEIIDKLKKFKSEGTNSGEMKNAQFGCKVTSSKKGKDRKVSFYMKGQDQEDSLTNAFIDITY